MAKLRFLPPGSVQPPQYVDRCVGALDYVEQTRTAVHRLKFRGRQSIAVPFGRLLAYQVRKQMDEDFDFVPAGPTPCSASAQLSAAPMYLTPSARKKTRRLPGRMCCLSTMF